MVERVSERAVAVDRVLEMAHNTLPVVSESARSFSLLILTLPGLPFL